MKSKRDKMGEIRCNVGTSGRENARSKEIEQYMLALQVIGALTADNQYEHTPTWKILLGYDSIEAGENEKGFGAYEPETETIYIPTDLPYWRKTLPETMAHEYYHFIQHLEGIEFSEEDANEFAKKFEKIFRETNAIIIEQEDCRESMMRSIEEQPTVNMPDRNAGKWIPVEERLPDEETRTLVTFEDGFVTATEFYGNGWDLWADSGEVIAWMPLPEPYNKEGDAG